MFSRVSAPCNAELPFHRAAYFAGSSTASITAVSAAEEHLSGVQIRVGPVPAGHAAEDFAEPARGVNHAAGRTGLTGVVSLNLDEGPARGRQLIAEHRTERRPSGAVDLAAEATAHHPLDVQILDDHDAVALGVAV